MLVHRGQQREATSITESWVAKVSVAPSLAPFQRNLQSGETWAVGEYEGPMYLSMQRPITYFSFSVQQGPPTTGGYTNCSLLLGSPPTEAG